MTVKFLDNQALAMLKLLEHRGKNYNFAEEKKINRNENIVDRNLDAYSRFCPCTGFMDDATMYAIRSGSQP